MGIKDVDEQLREIYMGTYHKDNIVSKSPEIMLKDSSKDLSKSAMSVM